MSINSQGSSVKLMCSDHKITKMYCENNVIYSSGNTVIYHVDTGISYQEEVDEGESCLVPKTFTPSKSGWTFVGWRTDSSAGTVLTSKVMEDNPVTLYAVFKQTITLSYNGNGNTGGATAAQTGTRYYNTGNYSNPNFSLQANGFSRSGYNFSKWALGSAGGTQYAAGASVTLAASTTMYAVWVSAGYYAIKEGNPLAAPYARAWSGSEDQTGRITGNIGVFYYGAHGLITGSGLRYGAATGNLPTNGCGTVVITTMDGSWGSDVPLAAVKVIGITSAGAQTTVASYYPKKLTTSNKYSKTFNVLAYAHIAITIETVSTDSSEAWINVGFTDVQFY